MARLEGDGRGPDQNSRTAGGKADPIPSIHRKRWTYGVLIRHRSGGQRSPEFLARPRGREGTQIPARSSERGSSLTTRSSSRSHSPRGRLRSTTTTCSQSETLAPEKNRPARRQTATYLYGYPPIELSPAEFRST